MDYCVQLEPHRSNACTLAASSATTSTSSFRVCCSNISIMAHKLEFLSYWSGFDSIIMHLNWLSWSWFSFILDVYRVANCVNIESVGVVSRCLKLFPCTVSTLLYISTDYMHSKVQKLNASSSTQWALSKQWTNCIEVDRNSGQTKSKQESYHRLSKLETDVAAMFTRKSVLEGLNNKLFRSFVAYSLS